ncbi:MAG: hypothetical protein ACLGHX_13060, partial [Acidimicrobiia bacterium]
TSPPAVDAPCATGPQTYVESGGAGLLERDDTDADIVSGIRWATFPDCERVVVDFAASSGAPAVAPPGVGPLFIRSSGVLRLQLDPAVSRSALVDQRIEGAIFDRAFVVRRPTGELFVDLHLVAPALIRVSVASGPARIVVDAIPGGDGYPSPAIITDDLVVVDPSGTTAVYPFTVNGYTRRPQTIMQVEVEAGGVTELFEGEVGVGGDAWGAFTVLIPDGPDGQATMIVGGSVPLSMSLS